MNDTKQVLTPTGINATEMRELSATELLAVAGGPQVTNDVEPPPAPPANENP